MYEPNNFELWRERRAEMMREAERERLAKELRAARKKRAGRTAAFIWEIKRIAGRLRKRSRPSETDEQRTDE